MKKITVLALIFLLSMLQVMAQSNAVSLGGEATGSGGSASFTAGEVFYRYKQSASGSATEGVQQPYERPTASLSGTTTICAGATAQLSISFTGTAPFSGTLSDGTPFSGSSSPISVDVTPASNTTYTIASLSSAVALAATADLSDSAVITVTPLPVVSMQSLPNICSTANPYILGSVSPVGGVFSGSGVSYQAPYYYFNPVTAGVGDHGITYTFTNGCTNTAQQTITVTPDSCGATKVKDEFCGTVLATLSGNILCYAVSGATDYRYQFTDVSDNSILTKARGSNSTGLAPSTVTGIKYSRTYDVVVAAKVGGVFLDYGRTCQVTMPGIPNGSLKALYCGTTMSTGEDLIYATSTPLVTNYEFKLRSMVDGSIIVRASNSAVGSFKFNGGSYNGSQQYSVVVRNFSNGVWGAYGDSCYVTSPSRTTQLTTAYCGQVLSSIGAEIKITPVYGATNYQYTFICQSGGPVIVKQRGSNASNLLLSTVSGLKLGRTYDVKVKAYISGVWGLFGNTCSITMPNPSAPTVQGIYCGTSINLATDLVYVNTIAKGTEYEFKLSSTSTSTVLNKLIKSANPGFNFGMISYYPGDLYDVQVRVFADSIWSSYGSVCQIRAPFPRVTSPSCGSTLSNISDLVRISPMPNATDYAYQLTDVSDNSVLNYTRGSNASGFYLSSIPGVKYNRTYRIVVKAKIGLSWMNSFGSGCELTTPSTPALTSLNSVSCNSTVAGLTSYINITPVYGATDYEYEFTKQPSLAVINKLRGGNFSSIRLSSVAGLTAGSTYQVKVRSLVNGVWTAYGNSCGVIIPSIARLIHPEENTTSSETIDMPEAAAESIAAYPNPFTGSFNITGSASIDKLMVYDLSGRVCQKYTDITNSKMEIGGDLEEGVYFVEILTKQGTVKTIRMVKIK